MPDHYSKQVELAALLGIEQGAKEEMETQKRLDEIFQAREAQKANERARIQAMGHLQNPKDLDDAGRARGLTDMALPPDAIWPMPAVEQAREAAFRESQQAKALANQAEDFSRGIAQTFDQERALPVQRPSRAFFTPQQQELPEGFIESLQVGDQPTPRQVAREAFGRPVTGSKEYYERARGKAIAEDPARLGRFMTDKIEDWQINELIKATLDEDEDDIQYLGEL